MVPTKVDTTVEEQCICLLDAIYSNFEECQEFISILQDLETKVLSNEYKDLVTFQQDLLQKVSCIPSKFLKTVTFPPSTRKRPELYALAPMYNSINFRKESLLYTVNIPNQYNVHSSLYAALKINNGVHRLFIKHNPDLLIEARDNFNIILTIFLHAHVTPCTNKQLSHVNAQTVAVHPLGEYHALSTTAGFHGWIKVKIAKISHVNTIIPSELAGQVFNDQLSVHKLSTTAPNMDNADEAKQQFIHTIMGIITDSVPTVNNNNIDENMLNTPSPSASFNKATTKTSATTEPIINTMSDSIQSSASIKMEPIKPIAIATSKIFQSSSKALRDMRNTSIHKKTAISKENYGSGTRGSDLRSKTSGDSTLSLGHHLRLTSRNHLSSHIKKPSRCTLSPYLTGKPQLCPRLTSLSNSKLETLEAAVESKAKVDPDEVTSSLEAPNNASVFVIDDSEDCAAEKRSHSPSINADVIGQSISKATVEKIIMKDVAVDTDTSNNPWESLESFCMQQGVDIIQKDQIDIPYSSSMANAAGYFKKVYYTKDNQVAQIFVRSTASQKILEIVPLLMLKNSPHIGQIKGLIVDQDGPIGLTMHRYKMTLEKHLKDHKHQKLSAVERLDIILQLLDSVQESHQAGIAHRDLSTVNFMVDTEEDKSNVYLIDFGKAVFTDPQTTSDWWCNYIFCEQEVIPTTKEELTVWCKNLPMVMAKPDHGYPMYRSIQTLPRSMKDQNILPHLINPIAEDIYSLGAIIWRVFSDMQPWPGVLDTSFKELREACKSDYHIDKVLERNITGPKSRELLRMFLRVRPEDRKSIEDVKRWIQSEENKSILLEEWSSDRKSKRGSSRRVVTRSITTKMGKQSRKNQAATTVEVISRMPSLSPQLEFTQHALSRQSSHSSLSSLVPLPDQVYSTNSQKRKNSDDNYDHTRVKRREVDSRLT